MPDNIQELEGVLYATRDEFGARIGRLETDIRDESVRAYNTISSEMAELKYKFEVLFNDVNAALLKLQECARREDLVDDMGGTLDEFIERFVLH